MKIIVLGGGTSPEREVSLRSAKSVANAAREAGFEVQEMDPRDGLSFLDGLDNETIIFPILHGAGGEDGVLQKELEDKGIKFLGSGSESSRDCFNKWTTRQLLQKNNIPIPEGYFVDKLEYMKSDLYSKPHVLKTPEGGSSIGTYVVRDPKNIDNNKVNEVFAFAERAVLEELIDGTEITVPILGVEALPVIEIQPPEEGFDYENKYNGRTRELCPPETVSLEIQKKAQEIAEQVHKAMGAKHLSRVDIMIDSKGSLYVLEINTMPGMTDQSLYPKAAAVAGLPMPELIKQLVSLAV